MNNWKSWWLTASRCLTASRSQDDNRLDGISGHVVVASRILSDDEVATIKKMFDDFFRKDDPGR